MKKRFLMLSLCFLLSFSCVSCNASASNTEDTQNTQQTDSQSGVQGSEDTSQNTEIAKATILDNRIKLDEKGILWQIPNTYVEQGLQQQILFFEENLLVYGTNKDENGTLVFQLAILSTETGEVLQKISLSDLEIPNIQVCGDTIVVADWGTRSILFLNEELKTIETYHSNTKAGGIYVNSDATNIYCFTQKEGIQVTNRKTQETSILLENTANLLTSNVCGDFVSVGYTDLDTQLDTWAVVDLKTGKVETIPFSGVFYDIEYQDEIWKVGKMGEENTYLLGKAQRPNQLIPNRKNSMVNMLSNPTRLLTTAYDETGASIMTLYDISGNFLSETEVAIEGANLFYDPIWSETYGGYFFTVTDSSGKDILLFWDLSTPVNGEILQINPQYETTSEIGTEVSKSLYEKAQHISSAYGIEIKIAEQTETEFSDFMVQRELDESYISSALDVLENVCASYPDNFMEQLLYGTQRKIEVHLVGTLTKRPSEETHLGFTSFAGFAEQQEGKSVIAVDITRLGSLEQTLYHEIAHLIDNKLAFDASLREDAIYSEEAWQALNPTTFVYAESYHNLPMELYKEEYDAYFIDIYSRTFSKEDRARIMEYAMVESDWTFSASSGRLAKLEYWTECIRDAFDTTGWSKQTIWEKTLEECLKK